MESAVRRIKLTVRYEGGGFAGSQIQPGFRTVAGTLTTGLETILDQSVHLVWAGRTDAGVHADGNICCFDGVLPYPAEKIPLVLNPVLPEDLEVRSGELVPEDFNPRYDAISREYVYRVYRGTDVPVDRRRYVASHEGGWDHGEVARVLECVAGEHYFHNFAKRGERNGGVKATRPREQCRCRLEPVRILEQGPEVWFYFKADRFLWQMIRRIAGAIMMVAEGRLDAELVQQALDDDEMCFQLKPAPAKGLTLLKVDF